MSVEEPHRGRAPEEAGEPRYASSRREAVEGRLSTATLIGAFFHSEDIEWQGIVVAEPAPGIYLIETFDWVTGRPEPQRLVRIHDMLEWRFYDSAQSMNDAHDRMQPLKRGEPYAGGDIDEALEKIPEEER